MGAVRFESRPLPDPVGGRLRTRLEREHEREPFSPLDPRSAVRRVIAVADELGLVTRVYRGGVDLRGIEADHVWLEVTGENLPAAYVVDAAFPLFIDRFVDTLRRFVAGDAQPTDLLAAAAEATVGDRVIGMFPRTVRYHGAPVWRPR